MGNYLARHTGWRGSFVCICRQRRRGGGYSDSRHEARETRDKRAISDRGQAGTQGRIYILARGGPPCHRAVLHSRQGAAASAGK